MRIGGVVRWLRVLFPYLPAGAALPRAGRVRVEACIWVRVWCVAFGGAAQRVGRQSLPPQKEKWGEAALSSLPPSPPPLSLSHLPQAHWSRAPFPRKTKAPRSLPEPGWEGRNTPKRQAGEEGAGAAREGGPPTLQARPPAQKKTLRAWRCVARHAAESGAGARSITFFFRQDTQPVHGKAWAVVRVLHSRERPAHARGENTASLYLAVDRQEKEKK